MGHLLSQQLVAAGERVVDVPATLAARTRVLGRTRSNKTDPNDARSVALTALRHASLREVRAVGHSEVLRLLAKRNRDIGHRRTQVVGRVHALLVELRPGGIAKEINASDVVGFLAQLTRRRRSSGSAMSLRSSCSTTSSGPWRVDDYGGTSVPPGRSFTCSCLGWAGLRGGVGR
jgi:hypothetical protein